MTITLTTKQESLVADRLSRGGYISPEHVAAEAFKLLEAKEERERALSELRDDIEVGWRDAEQGRLMDGPTAMAALIAKATARVASAE